MCPVLVLLTLFHTRDVPDPDTGIRYAVKFRHPALSSIRVKFRHPALSGIRVKYLPDSTVTYFITTIKRKKLRKHKHVLRGELNMLD